MPNQSFHIRPVFLRLVAAAILFIGGSAFSATTWKQIRGGLPVDGVGAFALAMDPTNPSTLYSWTDYGSLFKSADGAESWNAIGGVSEVHSLVIDPQDSSTMYAVAQRGCQEYEWRDELVGREQGTFKQCHRAGD
jgi:hypothetical protein